MVDGPGWFYHKRCNLSTLLLYFPNMRQQEFVSYILEDQLASLSGLSSRPMFGGFGLYCDGVIVGIVIEDELYLKVDATNKPHYVAMGSSPFSYRRNGGKEVALSYWKVPLEALEERERLTALFLESFAINRAIAETKARRLRALREKKDHAQ